MTGTNYIKTIPFGLALIALGLSGVVCAPLGESQDTRVEIVPEVVPSDVPEPCCDDCADPPPPVPPYDYEFTHRDRLLGAQACVHEASWAGGQRTHDCGGILQVVMARRRLERRTADGRLTRRAETFEEALARTMPRFYARTTTRAWVRELPAGPITRNPPSWPAAWSVPARRYSDSWHNSFRRTSMYMDGVEPLPCFPTPRQWFGRAVDHEAIARAIAAGWAESDCGEPAPGEEHATVNAMLYELEE